MSQTAKRKSQLWYLDYITAITMFTVILIIAFRYITNDYLMEGKNTDQIFSEAGKFSESLLTPGIPLNWSPENVVYVGICNDNVINSTKLDMLKNMTRDNYQHTRYILGQTSDFLIYFENQTGDIINLTNQAYIGKPGVTLSDVVASNPKNLITVTRYLVYKYNTTAQIVAMKLIAWKD